MSTEAKPKHVLLEVTISAPVDAVWRAVREPDQLRNWFGWDADTLAEEIDVIFLNPDEVDAQAHTIRFASWEGIADGFELIERDGGTVLRVVRFGAAPSDWDETYEDVYEGWVTFVQQLRLWLEQHRGERRRTLYLSGAALPESGPPSAALGLAGLRRHADGTEYRASLGPGDELDGAIWHRTAFQLGVGSRPWGDGLLVVTDFPPQPKRPHGGGSVLLTTFGLDDPAFAALEQRWRRWWSERYPDDPEAAPPR